jgi:hypothetical protein
MFGMETLPPTMRAEMESLGSETDFVVFKPKPTLTDELEVQSDLRTRYARYERNLK